MRAAGDRITTDSARAVRLSVPAAALLLVTGAGAAPPAGRAAARRETVAIDSVEELRACAGKSGQAVRMKPGVYPVKRTLPDDPKTVFRFSGSNNRFDLRGVTLQVDTNMLGAMPRATAHGLGVYRIAGSRLVFRGAVFENVGNHAPRRSLTDFSVTGDEVTFTNCRFIVRGSAPWGYGSLYGKGRGSAVRLQKHSCLSVSGNRCLIEKCDFTIHSFGHGIHLHGADKTVIRNVTMDGALRPTDDLYAETDGPAAEHDYTVMFPPWRKGEPIPKGEMLSLTEDGIRAYSHTGFVTVENCTVKRMRGGITITQAAGATVTGCTVLDCGGHAYSLPSNATVRNCRGNAAYAPLLVMPYANRRNADIELTLLDADRSCGDHPLATVVGSGHRIVIDRAGDGPPAKRRPLILGRVAGGRYTAENTEAKKLRRANAARGIVLHNRTPHPVILTRYATGCTVESAGPVEDRGGDTAVTRCSGTASP